ncbi:hypothetical protein ERJ75_001125400 [Trypanosoma vivax]|nr:hypothetical protein ERJ75_001125400 [Trypanosoma vivax]
MASGEARCVSLTHLSGLAQDAEALRDLLRCAFLDDAPRLEMKIFESLLALLDKWLTDDEGAQDDEAHKNSDAKTLIEQYYLQEVFAALLLLGDEACLASSEVPIARLPRLPVSAAPRSAFYVDTHARRYCAEVLIYLCFSHCCRTHRVVRALYPLLLEAAPIADGSVSQNHIGEGLLTSRRFQAKKKFVSSLLNGILLSLPDGLRAVVRVLLLDANVDDSLSIHAAKHVARLFTSSLSHAWIGEQTDVLWEQRHALKRCVLVKYCAELTMEEQVRRLSSQLIDIALCHAEAELVSERQCSVPNFAQRTEERLRVNPETMEERLHICLTTISNAILHLPSRSENEAAFKQCFRRFCLYNRFFLTPAFRALTLRVGTNSEPVGVEGGAPSTGEDEVLPALRRLRALAKGSSLGPSPLALMLAIQPLSPAILELCALRETLPTVHSDEVKLLLEALWRIEEKFDELAYIFVRGVFAPVRGHIRIDRVAARVHVDISSASPAARRMKGLRDLLLCETTPAGMCFSVLMALTTECQERAAVCGVAETVSAIPTLNAGVPKARTFSFIYKKEESALGDCAEVVRGGENVNDTKVEEMVMMAQMVEGICLCMNAEAVFGATASLERVCDVLSCVSTVSLTTWRWAALLVPHVFSTEIVNTVFAQYVTATEKQAKARSLRLRLERLKTVMAGLCPFGEGIFDEQEAALTLTMKTVEEYCGETDACHDEDTTYSLCRMKEAAKSLSLCHDLTVAVERSLETRSTASLVVHLLSISRLAEETANVAGGRCQGGGKSKSACTNDLQAVKEVQSAMKVLCRVLAEVDDACAAVSACKALVWWSIARSDSLDSSFVARLLLDLLRADVNRIPALKLVLPTLSLAVTPAHVSRLKTRVLDVLLGFCDYDTEGRTLRNIDDYCKQAYGYCLFDVVADLCGPQHSAPLQVAALHLAGHIVVSTYPRISLARACGLCADVFRHTPHAMAKAAASAMLANILAALEVLDEVGVAQLLPLAEAMLSYRSGADKTDAHHEDVIRSHGRCIKELVHQQQQQQLLAPLVQEL